MNKDNSDIYIWLIILTVLVIVLLSANISLSHGRISGLEDTNKRLIDQVEDLSIMLNSKADRVCHNKTIVEEIVLENYTARDEGLKKEFGRNFIYVKFFDNVMSPGNMRVSGVIDILCKSPASAGEEVYTLDYWSVNYSNITESQTVKTGKWNINYPESEIGKTCLVKKIKEVCEIK